MPRIIGIDIPRDKKIYIALTYIYGIGQKTSERILDEVGVDPHKRAKDLTEKDISDLTGVIQKSLQVEGDLRREVQQNIKRKMDVRCYQGLRHMRGLPVRGQRTHTNSRTRKGPKKTIGGLNKQPTAK
ncbi:MAG: 30S ribosomal protein S13 [Candidatus Omnitrophota bacterium]|nr:30S ribosomal protein S13 [Candidatus Omnitrophota bacterium]